MDLALIATIDDLVVGLLIGAAIGFLAGPVLRSRIAAREWVETRRESRLTDELLARLEALDLGELGGLPDVRGGAGSEPPRPDGSDPADRDATDRDATDRDAADPPAARVRWRTSR
ncbi:MAG TPA: hypothetical protein VFQ40_02110 [Actinomycetota bacterium]|nr:hypothetical protein [Actinomycetota bacterium]